MDDSAWTRGVAVAMFAATITAVVILTLLMWLILAMVGVPVGVWRDGVEVAFSGWMAFQYHAMYRDAGIPMPWDARFRADD